MPRPTNRERLLNDRVASSVVASGRLRAVGGGRTWVVMLRDVTHAVRVEGQETTVTGVVLDVDTGLMLGATIAESYPQACREVFHAALTTPVPGAPFRPGPPARVACAPDHLADVDDQLRAVIGREAPAAEGIIPDPEAEDIVDSLVGHLSGRAQPVDPPRPEDWTHLIRLAADFAEAKPWERTTATEAGHVLTVTVHDETASYAAVVLGQQGLQRGLVLYPGTELPDAFGSWRPGQPATVPDGTLMCYLDPPDDTVREAVNRAARYGWPGDAELFPLFMTMNEDEPADIGQREAYHLALGLAAVLRLGASDSGPLDGVLALPTGDEGTYSLTSTGVTTPESAADVGDAWRILEKLLDGAPGPHLGFPASLRGQRPSQRRPRRADVVTYRVRTDLKGAKPPCWRRLELASDLMLHELHEILQVTFGWRDEHLHKFAAGPTSFYDHDSEHFLNPFDMAQGEDGVPEHEVRLDEVLSEPGDRLFYLYDFGDDWEHLIKLEAVLPRDTAARRAVCTKGRRPEPPEDCGGIWGYELAVAANDPAHPHHRQAVAEFRDMHGEEPASVRPVPFDIERVNTALAKLLG